MPLTNEQASEIKKWIDAHIPNYHCPLCPSRKYTIDDIRLADSSHSNSVDTKEKPIVQIVCPQCSHIMSFSSEKMGI